MPKRSVPTLSEWFIEWLTLKDLRPRSVSNYRSQFIRHVAPLLGHRRLDTLGKTDAQTLFNETKRNSAHRPGVLDPGRVNAQRSYALLHVLMNDAVEFDKIDSHKVHRKAMGKDASAKRPDFTLGHYSRVRDHLSGPYRDATDIILGAGLRRGEALGLVWRDWDPVTGLLWIERQSDGVNVWETKTSNPAHVQVMDVAVVALEAMRTPWVKLDAPILQMPAGAWRRRMTKGKLADSWNRARGSAGLPNFHLHDLRHLALTHMARSGATLVEIQEFGRHKDSGSALRYQHANDEGRRWELKTTADERMLSTIGRLGGHSG